MNDQHRATADEWTAVKALASGGVAYSCILELLHRIEALEARDEDDKEAWAARLRRPGRSQAERIASLAERITSLQKRIDALEAAQPAKPNHPEIPDSSLKRRVSEHIKAQSVLTSALVKRLEALEGVPLDGAVPAKVPGGLPALAEKVKALEDTVNATTQPNHPAKPDSSLVERVAAAIHPNVCADPNLYLHEARAAIREVAAWLRKHYGGPTATTDLLEREAER